MKKILLAVVLAVFAVLAYLLFKPTPVDPMVWTAPVAPKLEGPYAVNTIMKDVQRLAVGVGIGPEGVAVDEAGNVYAGYEDGRVIRLAADAATYTELANTGGRPLGTALAPGGSLLVADAAKGLVKIGEGGAVTLLAKHSKDGPIVFADDVDVATGEAAAYFSDASIKFPNPYYLRDVLEHRPNGRVLRHDLASGESVVLPSEFHFANGVALGPNGDYLLVSETSLYRITRIWLKGEKVGTSEVFIDNLPGFPDNLSFNGRDRFWVALAGPRNPQLDALAGWPLLRKMMARLPGWIQNKLAFSKMKQSFVLGFDLEGKPVANLQYEAADAYSPITSVEEHGPWLYFGSLSEPAIARLPLNRAIADAPAPPEGWQQAPAQPKKLELGR